MSDTAEEVTPALFDHARRVYEEMLRRSHKEFQNVEGGGSATEDDTVDVYEGHLTRLFADLTIPNPYYTKILDALKGQNCIAQLRRGGGAALSKWALLEPPTEESFRAITERRRAPKGKQAQLEQRVGDVLRQYQEIVNRVEILEDRIAKLEA